jgi:lipoate-protein ligase A
MEPKVKDLTIKEFRTLISETVKETLEDLIEDFSALTSDQFIKSIEEARADYKEGKFKNLEEILDA